MKSPNSIIMMMDQLLSELDQLETGDDYKRQMKTHINGMCVLTLLNYKSQGKKAVLVAERSK